MVDGIAGLQATVVSALGGKPERPAPSPRPRTAVDDLRERRSLEAQQAIVSLFYTPKE